MTLIDARAAIDRRWETGRGLARSLPPPPPAARRLPPAAALHAASAVPCSAPRSRHVQHSATLVGDAHIKREPLRAAPNPQPAAWQPAACSSPPAPPWRRHVHAAAQLLCRAAGRPPCRPGASLVSRQGMPPQNCCSQAASSSSSEEESPSASSSGRICRGDGVWRRQYRGRGACEAAGRARTAQLHWALGPLPHVQRGSAAAGQRWRRLRSIRDPAAQPQAPCQGACPPSSRQPPAPGARRSR